MTNEHLPASGIDWAEISDILGVTISPDLLDDPLPAQPRAGLIGQQHHDSRQEVHSLGKLRDLAVIRLLLDVRRCLLSPGGVADRVLGTDHDDSSAAERPPATPVHTVEVPERLPACGIDWTEVSDILGVHVMGASQLDRLIDEAEVARSVALAEAITAFRDTKVDGAGERFDLLLKLSDAAHDLGVLTGARDMYNAITDAITPAGAVA